jgi:hypothetical protein
MSHHAHLRNTAVFGALVGLAALAAPCAPQPIEAQGTAASASDTDGLPFFSGERLTYRVRVSRFGGSGKGEMTVEGPVDLRGRPTYVLRSNVETRVGPVKAVNRSESWLDVVRMATLRFSKRERSLGSKLAESVELFPERRVWQTADGRVGASPTDAPLDELSFIYFLRTISLVPDSTYRYERHFDPARNPTIVRVLGRERVETRAGTFSTLLIEMRVKDPARYRGDGVIRINMTDDHCRLPVRIVSDVPLAGEATLTLEAHSHPVGHGRIGVRVE